MKYQIYLNKKTSSIVNLIAKSTNKAPATIIKEFMEDMIEVAFKSAKELTLDEVSSFMEGGEGDDTNHK